MWGEGGMQMGEMEKRDDKGMTGDGERRKRDESEGEKR
jgi:hypothetical protein